METTPGTAEHAVPLLAGWVPPPHLMTADAGELALPEGWRLGVLRAGLVLRHPQADLRPVVGPRPDPDQVDLHVVAPGGPVPYPVLVALAWVIRSLPGPAHDRVRLLVAAEVDADALADLAAALRVPVLQLGAAPLSPPYATAARGPAPRRGGLVTARLDLVPAGVTDPAAVTPPPQRAWRTEDPFDSGWRPGMRRRSA